MIVFEGAQTPFVLRRVGALTVVEAQNSTEPVQKTFQVYQLIGECYLHGWMNGEAMNKDRGLESKEIVLF